MSNSLNLLVENIQRLLGGMSQREFCRKNQINPTQFSRYMQKSTHPTTETLDKIARGLNVEAYQLLAPLEVPTSDIETRLTALEAKIAPKAASPVDRVLDLVRLIPEDRLAQAARMLEDLLTAPLPSAHKKGTGTR